MEEQQLAVGKINFDLCTNSFNTSNIDRIKTALNKLDKSFRSIETFDDSQFYYYYIRDDNNKPLITVCLLKGKNGIAKGIAICSPNDNPEKAKGKDEARKRAVKSYLGKRTGDFIRSNRALETIDTCKGYLYEKMYNLPKVWFNPELSNYEKRILRKSNAKC